MPKAPKRYPTVLGCFEVAPVRGEKGKWRCENLRTHAVHHTFGTWAEIAEQALIQSAEWQERFDRLFGRRNDLDMRFEKSLIGFAEARRKASQAAQLASTPPTEPLPVSVPAT